MFYIFVNDKYMFTYKMNKYINKKKEVAFLLDFLFLTGFRMRIYLIKYYNLVNYKF